VKALYKRLTDTEGLPDPPEGMLVIYRNPRCINGKAGQNLLRLSFREPVKEPPENEPRASTPQLSTEPEIPRSTEPELPGSGGDIPLINDHRGRPSTGNGDRPKPVFRVKVPYQTTVPARGEAESAGMTSPASGPQLAAESEAGENPPAGHVRTGDNFHRRFWQIAWAMSGLALIGWCLWQYSRRED
jgi:hypothetical protein